MNIIIREVGNCQQWDKFFNNNGSPSFLESWEWGEFQKKIGYQILRLGIYDNNKLQTICLIIKIKAKRGNFLFVPHGPIIQAQNSKLKTQSYISKLKTFLIKLAKKENCSFIRIAPILVNSRENRNIFKVLGFKTAPIYMHAETVWQLSLDQTDDEILAQMRKTTRYSIKKASRDGAIIESRSDNKAVNDFFKIYQETAIRENFVPFSKDYIRKEFETFNKNDNALFLFARINDAGVLGERLPTARIAGPSADGIIGGALAEGNPKQAPRRYLASALILFTKSTAFYHQGASYHTRIPATYLLQWEAIRQAKKRGCKFYNFWGIYDEESNRMPKAWQGLTLFKIGFGGNKKSYLPTQDYIISPRYYLSHAFEKILSWRRGV